HMPSHIFTRLGFWDESIASNSASSRAGLEYAQKNFPDKTWDQRLHPMDYLVYAYLQKGQDQEAKKIVDEIAGIQKTQPENNTAGYALAAIPARYAIERERWEEAAKLEPHPPDFPWSKFPWSQSITVFARGLGEARTGNVDSAKKDLTMLETLRDALR